MISRKKRKRGAKPARKGAGRKPTDPPNLSFFRRRKGVTIERDVYDALRHGLMSGAIYPGQVLTSRSLSCELDTSPMPVRVGLKRLESDGALTSKNKGSFLVSDPDQEEFQDILRIRLVLECFAIREAALRATVGDLPALHRLNEEYHRLLRAGKDGARKSLIPNFNFHFRIYELAGSPNLVDLIGRLWLRIGPTLQRYVGGNAVVNTDFHGSMLDGLVRNDPEIAAAALTDDLTTAASAIIPLLRPRAESTKITLDGGGDE